MNEVSEVRGSITRPYASIPILHGWVFLSGFNQVLTRSALILFTVREKVWSGRQARSDPRGNQIESEIGGKLISKRRHLFPSCLPKHTYSKVENSQEFMKFSRTKNRVGSKSISYNKTVKKRQVWICDLFYENWFKTRHAVCWDT